MVSLKGLPPAASASACASCSRTCIAGCQRLNACFRRASLGVEPAAKCSLPSRDPALALTPTGKGSRAASRPLLTPTQTSLYSSHERRREASTSAERPLAHPATHGPMSFCRSLTPPAAKGLRPSAQALGGRRDGALGCLRGARLFRTHCSMPSHLASAFNSVPSGIQGPTQPATPPSSPPGSQPLTSPLGPSSHSPAQPSSAHLHQHSTVSSAAAVAMPHLDFSTAELRLEGTAVEQRLRRSQNGAWHFSADARDPFFSRTSEGSERLSWANSLGTEGRSRQRHTMEPTPMIQEAWELLHASTVYYCNQPVGTVAASDPTDTSPLNYDQVFIRDFIPSALAFMLSGQSEIVRNFLLYTLQLQSWEKTVDCHRPGEGLMPASFKVTQIPVEGAGYGEYEEHLDPDFGESAIGRVAPVDSGLWWIQLLRAYGRCTGDYSLQQRVDVQTGIKLILKICLADHFDMFPTLITTDGSCMIDRRLGIHGHPLEIQSLLYGALRAAKEMLLPENGGSDLIRAVDARLTALSFHIRHYYWLDIRKLNEIYRYKTEEYSYEAVNKFNIYPEQIPGWLMDWIPDRGGYFLGNVQPAHMDFRFFGLGNMWAVVSALASPAQAEAVLDLVEERWEHLVGAMPLKIVYPALEGEEWRIITGADPKNTPWSYHNGGSWPVLLWQFTAACIKMGRPHLAQKAVEIAERRLQVDRWPEYYDTKSGRFIGKQARLHQTWSIAGYLASKLLLANPEAVWLFAIEEDHGIMEATSSFICSSTGHPKRRKIRGTSPLPLISTLAV